MNLVCIHGAGSSSLSYYYITKHSPKWEALDLPGHPKGRPCSSIEEYTQWVRGYLWGNGYQDVVPMGHSMGGAIAQTYALSYPEELRGIILSGTGARLRVHPDYLRQELEASKDEDKYEEWLQEREDGLSEVSPALRARLVERSAEVGPAVQYNDMSACNRFDVMDRVHLISLPTLILVGTEDIMTPVRYSRYLNEKISGSQLEIFEGASHSLQNEQPQKVIHAIETFLANL